MRETTAQPYALTLMPRPAVRGNPEREPLVPGALVLTDDTGIMDVLRSIASPDVKIVLVPDEVATWDEDAVTGFVLGTRPVSHHLRVITSLRRAEWPCTAAPGLLALQEAAFVALKQLAGSATEEPSSVAILVLDRFDRGTPHPHAALLTGLAKSVAWEMPGVPVHAVVTDDLDLPSALATLRAESGCVSALPVAYYRTGPTGSTSAVRWEERLTPIEETSFATMNGDPSGTGPVVVAVGGARGITARCVEALSPRPSRLWLLGSTDPAVMIAQAAEIGDLSGADYVRGKAEIGHRTGIGALRATYDRCRRSRESLTTIAALRDRIGADRVHYLGCDVTDPGAVRRAAATIAGAEPRIDLLINGAGISGARRLKAKNLATFRQVRDTKIAGYRNLKASFRDPAPRAWCHFSSVAGVFGLPGEIDYGPANDMLNAASRRERSHGTTAEYAIGWSLWGESGIGPRSGFTDYTTRTGQLGLLSDAEGQRWFTTVVSGGLGQYACPVLLGGAERRLVGVRFPGLIDDGRGRSPYLDGMCHVDGDDTVWRLDFARFDHLRGHVRQSRALVPGALLVELAAVVTDYLTDGVVADIFRDVRFEAPVAVDPLLAEYALAAAFKPSGPGSGVVRVAIRSHIGTARQVSHVEARIPVGDDVDDAPTSVRSRRLNVRRTPATMAMTGLFDQVRDLSFAGDTTSARWEPAPTAEDHLLTCRTPWLLVDALLQTACATEAKRYATPRSIAQLRLHTEHNDLVLAGLAAGGVRLQVTHSDGITNGVACSEDGSPLVTLSGLVLSGRGGARDDQPS